MNETTYEERIGIMRNVRFGLNDRNHLALTFDVYMSENTVFGFGLTEWTEVLQVFSDADATDVRQLEGKPCWYRPMGGNVYQFVRVFRTPS